MRRVLAVLLAAACSAGGAAAQAGPAPALDRAAQRAVVDSVAAVLEARYVDAGVAREVGARLRERLAAGAYAADTLPAALGAALTRDMYAVSRDLHMRLNWEPAREFTLAGAAQSGPPPAAGVVRTGRVDGRDSATIARTNHAFQRVERLAGNVGYLKLDQFVPLDYAGATAAAAMAFLANSDAVIVDLRDNPGGSPDNVRFLLSHFFAPDTVLLWATANRGLRVRNEYRTLRDLPGRRLAGADLYVLTSRRSASSAETFAYATKWTGRGTVVGERTAGAGNGGARLSVGHGLALFVPQWQVTTGPGFERTGVEPDVEVPEDSALAAAHVLALRKLAARADDPRVRREREWALERVSAASRPAPSSAELARYAGAYGARAVRLRAGGLVLLSPTGSETPLVPVAEHIFHAGDAVRVRFETDAAGRVLALTVEQAAGSGHRAERTPDPSPPPA
ncbi:MAG TPA: S41 family peptidase [Longimicrobiaceae bacterium]|nr:S41 family peptidase [Longimicrobiaceae bacterium]